MFLANNKKKIIIITVIVVLVLVVLGVFHIERKKPKQEIKKEKIEKEEPASLGEHLYEQVQNPAKKIPQTNPYKAQTNPFEETQTNPFKGIYKNPFQ